MKFKKIDDTKFQCILYKEDMIEHNISMEDFLRNDAAKIHELLDVVIEEAYEQIGVDMDGTVMSLQLLPQPNQSLLLTVSGKKEENVLSQVGKDLMTDNTDKRFKRKNKAMKPEDLVKKAMDTAIMFSFDNMEDIESFASNIAETKGIKNSLYKNEDGIYYMLVERNKLSEKEYLSFITKILEYAKIYSISSEAIAFIKEHSSKIVANNAINTIQKYCK